MTNTDTIGLPVRPPGAPSDESQRAWRELDLRVGQLEADKIALEHENKTLRQLLERAIEQRLKSHTELVMILTNLVSKLPLNDVGVIVSKLVEHNTNTSQYLAALSKGAVDFATPQPDILKSLEQLKQDLRTALKPIVEELLALEAPLEKEVLESLPTQPDLFFSPRVVRANRCFVKGFVPRERIIREFGAEALVFFNDMTTDAKLNPRPKSEEIALGFKPEFEALFQQNPTVPGQRRDELLALYQKVHRCKAPTEQARAQKNAFQRLSFILELLHFYEHQDTEAPDAIFAQRLPSLLEQLVLAGPHETLDEKLIVLGESLLGFISRPDHRQMVINNVGKGGGAGKTLRFVLRLRAEKVLDSDPDHTIAEFVRHLIPPPPQKVPHAQSLGAVLRLIHPDMQRLVVKNILRYDRLRQEEAEALGKAVSEALGLKGLLEQIKAEAAVSPETERHLAWGKVKELIQRHTDTSAVAAAIRDRLNAKYDADEIRQSWLTLTEVDPMSLIRIICQLPYMPNGKTDPIARPVLETYVTRLVHTKYAGTYNKVTTSLRTLFRARPDNPTLLNFLALVRWANPEAATRLCTDVGMPPQG